MFSAVQDANEAGVLQVRTRSKEDALNLARWMVAAELVLFDDDYPTTESLVLEWKGRDYPYRVLVWREHWARFMYEQSMAISYRNFKDEVKKKQGYRRASIYGRIWGVLLDVSKEHLPVAPVARRTGMWDDMDWDDMTLGDLPSLASRLSAELKPAGAGLADTDARCPRCDKFLSDVGISADGACTACTADLDRAIEAERWDEVQEISIELDGAPAPF